ncbi:GINS complex subunit [Agyrium rufum]|nr:GINS complex subunit [Agyrium rufum]
MDIDDILADLHRDAEPIETQDLRELTRLWIAERSAPEILPWPEALMDRVTGRIRGQIELIEEQTGDTDPKTNFRLIIIQTELERFKFLVRSYLRARLVKIDKYPLHYLTQPTQRSKLSPSELQYSTTHQAFLSNHYHASFLSQLPANLQKLDDNAGGISMVEAPDVDRAVFVRALKDVTEPIVVEGTDMDFEMRMGQIFVVRWSAVREVLLRGEVEVL